MASAWPLPASVTLSSSGPVNVEVWNNNANVLLARRTVPATSGTQFRHPAGQCPHRLPAPHLFGVGAVPGDFPPSSAGAAAGTAGLVSRRGECERVQRVAGQDLTKPGSPPGEAT